MRRKNKKMLICQQKSNFYSERERKNNINENDDYQRRQQQKKEMQLNVSDNNVLGHSRECGLLDETKKMRKSNFPQFLPIILLLFATQIKIFVFASDLTGSSSIDNIFNGTTATTNVDETRIFGHFQGM